jgi:hypothetical protein
VDARVAAHVKPRKLGRDAAMAAISAASSALIDPRRKDHLAVALEGAGGHSKMQFNGRSDVTDLSLSMRRQGLSPGLEISSVFVASHRWRRSQLHRPKSDREGPFRAGLARNVSCRKCS